MTYAYVVRYTEPCEGSTDYLITLDEEQAKDYLARRSGGYNFDDLEIQRFVLGKEYECGIGCEHCEREK